MKRLIPALLLISLSTAALAQTQATETDFDFRSRTSVNLDWKVAKGLHLEGGYELRTSDKFSRIERNQFDVGVQYSPLKHLDIGAGYYYIGHYDREKVLKPRHRVYLHAMGSFKLGAWKMSLREMIQLTHKSYEFNRFQQTPNLVELKSRLKVSYKGFAHIEPYAYVELRNCFNGPSFTNNGKYVFTGYSDSYINRTRLALALQWNINRYHGLDIRLMTDWCSDKNIDTNAEGTKLKSFSWEKATNVTISIGYTFSIR